MAGWALDCAARVLPLFEASRPDDRRPARAIAVGREWVATGVFRMPVIRTASLDAHAGAKEAEDPAAIAAAHAAGQAVATAHVAQHAFGGALYALRAVAARAQDDAFAAAVVERAWQSERLPARLRDEVMDRVVVEPSRRGLRIAIRKDEGF